ncbi:MAG: alpha-ketoacid dehydrogenase subunit beta [Candidatus Omnitrophica bacterium]|nr:alpha-ketoacid dehydrogenase subunit beta [Candidatus Omnitrophota bacterium]
MYISEAINKVLFELLTTNPEVYLMGEDIESPYGGAFKITKNLSEQFKSRVINTPISESSLVGVASGMAMRGLRPVLEIMFGDFMTLGMDQLVNHASKFHYMYNGQVDVPMFIRTPMGGRRGYGPTHSQTLEKLLLGIPGIKVLALSQRHSFHDIYIHAVTKEKCPVILIENKALYSMRQELPENGRSGDFFITESAGPYPCLTLSLNNFVSADATVVTYGGMLPLVEKAATQLCLDEEIFVEIVVPSLLGVPLDINWVEASLRRTGRLVIVEEGTQSFGFGSEVAALACSKYFKLLKYPVIRIAAADSPIPCARHLENLVLPNEANIYQELKWGILNDS